MANAIQIKNDDNQKTAKAAIVPAREPRLEPMRMLRDLMAWDPLRDMQTRALRDWMGWDPLREMQLVSGPIAFSPSFEVKETKDAFVFKADVPGVNESDIEVTLTGQRLTISGKRQSELEQKTDRYYACERTYGDFSRTFTLPEGIDAKTMNADLKDGVLAVSVAKTPEAATRRIPVQAASKKP